MSRCAILCPGRGSYTERTQGSLPEDDPWVRRAEELRAEHGLPSLLELDRGKFRASTHLGAEHATMLIWLRSMLDARQVAEENEVVAVSGNSAGWYTALAVAGALSFDDGFRLAQRMGSLQERHGETHGGGQILYPLVDEDWQPSAASREAVAAAMAEVGEGVFESIRLGGYVVLAGTDEGLRALTKALPVIESGRNRFPFRLARHGPYHTPLIQEVADAARASFGGLGWTAPRVTLVDGRGVRHTPWATDPADLFSYTVGPQLLEPFDFTSSVRVVLREFAPERLVLPGPGNSLGGVVGQVLVAERWQGFTSKADLDAARAVDSSPILSLGLDIP